jgi:hypothetical protein
MGLLRYAKGQICAVRANIQHICQGSFFPKVLMSFFFFFLGLIGTGASEVDAAAASGTGAAKVSARAAGSSCLSNPSATESHVSVGTAAGSDDTVGTSAGLDASVVSSAKLCGISSSSLMGWLLGFRFNFGRDPHVAPPATGDFFAAV